VTIIGRIDKRLSKFENVGFKLLLKTNIINGKFFNFQDLLDDININVFSQIKIDHINCRYRNIVFCISTFVSRK